MFDLILGYPAETIATTALSIIGIAKIIVIATPTPKDDLWLQRIYKLIEICALVFGKAKDGYGKPVRKELKCPNCHADINIEP